MVDGSAWCHLALAADGALPSFAGASLGLGLACASPRRGFRPRGRPTFFAGAKKVGTESTFNSNTANAAQDGAAGYIVKPFTKATLEEKVLKIMQKIAATA